MLDKEQFSAPNWGPPWVPTDILQCGDPTLPVTQTINYLPPRYTAGMVASLLRHTALYWLF
jgi:hypothetical protein